MSLTANTQRKRHGSLLLRQATAALQDDLLAEGLIECPRIIYDKAAGGKHLSRGFDAGEIAAINVYLATKAPRVYAPNDTADDFNLCVFLRSKGFKVQRHCSTWGRRAPFWINEIAYNRAGFIAFVNAVRASLQMQPVGIPA